MTSIRVDSLSRAFTNSNTAGARILDGLSFTVESTKATCVVGPSGCGKTTLIRILAGILDPSDGRVERHYGDGTVVGYMPQSDSLLPWRTAIGNVSLGLELVAKGSVDIEGEAKRWLELVGLRHAEARLPRELSGGMRRRVALARTLAIRPGVLFLDEPLAHLDLIARRQMATVIRNYILSEKASMVMVTHSAEEAAIVSDRVLVLSGGPARIVAEFDTVLGSANGDCHRMSEAEVFERISHAFGAAQL